MISSPTRGEDALRDKHDHAGGHAGEIIHRVGGYGGDCAQTVLVEIAHRQIPQMLGDLHTLICRGAVACVCLQGGGAVFEQRRSNDRYQHNRKGMQDRFCGHAACQDRLQTDGDRRDLQCRKQRRQYAEGDGTIKLAALPLVTETEEFFQNLKHSPHLLPYCHGTQYARSRGTGTAGRFAEALPASLSLQRSRCSPQRSGRHPRWWRADGQ